MLMALTYIIQQIKQKENSYFADIQIFFGKDKGGDVYG